MNDRYLAIHAAMIDESTQWLLAGAFAVLSFVAFFCAAHLSARRRRPRLTAFRDRISEACER